MIFVFLIYTFFLIEFSLTDQCLVRDYCTCSADLTILNCNHRQITNELLFKLNSQLPRTTTYLNLSSNSLTSIKSLTNIQSLQILDLSSNQIRSIQSNFFSKFPRLVSLYLENNPLKSLPKYWRTIPNIQLNLSSPSTQSQIAYINQQLILNCSSNSKVFWRFNHQFYPSTIISSTYSIIFLRHLYFNHSGIWTCQNYHSTYSISLSVLQNSSYSFCQSIHMNTSKGNFYWPRTFKNQKIEIPCPFGSAAWFQKSKALPRAWYTCSSNGQWTNFDISQCAFQTNISQTFDLFSLNQTNLLFNLVKYLSKIDHYQMKFEDMILLIDLIDEQQDKFLNQDQIMLIYHLTDFILQIKSNFITNFQYQQAINRLRLIIEYLLDLTNQSWLYIGKELTAMTFQSPFPSTLCFVPNRSLLTIICDSHHQQDESHLVTIQFSSQSNQYSLYRVIVYRQSSLFNSNETSDQNHPVIYIRPISRRNFTTIRFIFSDQYEQMSIGIRQKNQTYWQRKFSICQIHRSKRKSLTTDCQLWNNKSLTITYFLQEKSIENLFLDRKYSHLILTISSIVGSITILSSIVFHVYIYKFSQIPRRIFHCLINYWFNLAILFPLFAFGIELIEYIFFCQLIAITLHFLCLTIIIWLTLLTYSIWKQSYIFWMQKDEDNNRTTIDHVVLPFYFLAYGTALIICGINVLISREQAVINKICFLIDFDSMLILILPILVFIFLLLSFLLFSRYYIRKISQLSTNHFFLTSVYFQYQSINQLLSILFQLIVLIFIFLSSLARYIHPLNRLDLRFEQIIYSHFYGFFVLFLAFYIISFDVFARFRSYFHQKKQTYISNPSLSIDSIENPSLTEPLSLLPSSDSHDLSNRHESEIEQERIYSSQRLINIASKYYVCHEDIMKTTSVPVSLAETMSQKTLDIQSSLYERSSKKSINIPIEYSTKETRIIPLILSQSVTYPRISSSQAIIRSLPIVRLSSQNPIKTSPNEHLTSSTDEYQILNQTNQPIQEKISFDNTEVLFIDEDEERSVSLKSSLSEIQTSSCTLSTKKHNQSQTLSISSSSSSSSLLSFTNDIHSKLRESSV